MPANLLFIAQSDLTYSMAPSRTSTVKQLRRALIACIAYSKDRVCPVRTGLRDRRVKALAIALRHRVILSAV